MGKLTKKKGACFYIKKLKGEGKSKQTMTRPVWANSKKDKQKSQALNGGSNDEKGQKINSPGMKKKNGQKSPPADEKIWDPDLGVEGTTAGKNKRLGGKKSATGPN